MPLIPQHAPSALFCPSTTWATPLSFSSTGLPWAKVNDTVAVQAYAPLPDSPDNGTGTPML